MGRIMDVMALPGRLMRLCRDLWKASRYFDSSISEILRRALYLFIRRGFRPGEALRCGLLDPSVSADAESGCIPKRRLIAQQRRYNPQTSECLTEDKSVFYAYCTAVELPIPTLYAVFDIPSGWSSTGEILQKRGNWEQFFDERLPEEFVVKPAEGVYGCGVNVYRRTANGFVDAFGVDRTASTLYEALRSDLRYRRFVIQERLYNHPDLERLTRTPALQTARVVTWARADGEVDIYPTYLKFILGAGVTDNYYYGLTGNLRANIGAEDGTLGPAFGRAPGEIGFRIVAAHPKTGVTISGFQVPFWQDARQLVSRAARLFWPLRTIGWDVALTPNGPFLVEGNKWWDPPNDVVIGPQAADGRRGGMATLLKRFETEAYS